MKYTYNLYASSTDGACFVAAYDTLKEAKSKADHFQAIVDQKPNYLGWHYSVIYRDDYLYQTRPIPVGRGVK